MNGVVSEAYEPPVPQHVVAFLALSGWTLAPPRGRGGARQVEIRIRIGSLACEPAQPEAQAALSSAVAEHARDKIAQRANHLFGQNGRDLTSFAYSPIRRASRSRH